MFGTTSLNRNETRIRKIAFCLSIDCSRIAKWVLFFFFFNFVRSFVSIIYSQSNIVFFVKLRQINNKKYTKLNKRKSKQ